MADGLNVVFLLGYIGSDAEMRYTNSGDPVVSFRMATSESWLDRERNRQERTEWHSCVLFGKLGESLHKYLLKSTRVHITGKLRTSSYNDRDGVKRYKTEITVLEVRLLGRKEAGQERPAEERRTSGGYGGGKRSDGPARGGKAPADGEPDGGADDHYVEEAHGGNFDDVPFVKNEISERHADDHEEWPVARGRRPLIPGGRNAHR